LEYAGIYQQKKKERRKWKNVNNEGGRKEELPAFLLGVPDSIPNQSL
jgi:hypothetical protein